jgi:hypothetical protein
MMLMKGKTQKAAAAAAGMSERSAREWQTGPLPSEAREPRWWRTREDPFADVWDEIVVPLLERDDEGRLESKTILEVLKEQRKGEFTDAHLRTLQRRVREWRALKGPEKEVIFPQEHLPGREAAVDFTHGTELGVTIRGVLFMHLLFELVLTYSGWTWICVAFGETFEALISGIQDAFWDLGGMTRVVRSDNLSAATHELPSGGRSLTKRFKAFLEHFDLQSTRIEPGEAHQNGAVEQRHHRTKSAIAQALIIRGSKDFDSVEEYEAFARAAVEKTHNARIPDDRMAAERAALRLLPKSRVPTYTTYAFKVRPCSTVRVAKRTYSVPSRLIGHKVEVRQHPNVVEVRYRGKTVETMPRLRGEESVRIDYRHVIWSLVRKPGAFARYRYREELFPTLVFRRAYDALVARRGERADIEYVRILHLAAGTLEATVEKALAQILDAGTELDYAAVKAIASPTPSAVPEVAIPAPDLAAYDRLLKGGAA